MLSIKNLKVSVEGNEILKGLDLEIKPGEVHAIMGPISIESHCVKLRALSAPGKILTSPR